MAELAKKGRRGASPGVWAPRVDAWQCCEGDPGVRKGRGPLVTRNCTGGTAYRRWWSSRNPAQVRLEPGQASSGLVLGARRGSSGGWPRLGGRGVAGSRRRRGLTWRSGWWRRARVRDGGAWVDGVRERARARLRRDGRGSRLARPRGRSRESRADVAAGRLHECDAEGTKLAGGPGAQ